MPKSGNNGRPSNRTKKTTGKSKPTKLRKNEDGSQSYVRGNTQKDKHVTARAVEGRVERESYPRTWSRGPTVSKRALGLASRETNSRFEDSLGMARAQGTARANSFINSLKKKKKK